MRRATNPFKAIGSATAASLVLCAFLTSAAQAGHTWEVNGVLMGAGTSKTCQATSDGTITVKSEVLKQPLHVTATSYSTTGCKISQNGSGSTAVAEGTTTKYSLSGLTTHEPEGCKVSSPISTLAVKTKVITVGGVAYTTMGPESGTEIASIVITGCAAAETYPLRGSYCAEMPQAGVFNVQQTFKFSDTADTACSTDIYTVGGKPAILRGSFVVELTGADAGLTWGFTTT